VKYFCGILFVLVLAYMGIGLQQIFVKASEYSLLDWVIILVLYFLLTSIEIFLFKKFKNYEHKDKKTGKKAIIQNNAIFEETVNKSVTENPKEIGYFKHISGLPIAENSDCYLYLYEDNIIMQSSGYKFNLLKSKIKDVSIKTDTEIQKQYVSNVGGAVAGAYLLGPIGAIIGGRAKQKKSKTSTDYLIFTYDKEGKPTVVGFEVSKQAYLSANKFVKDFRKNYRENVNVETIEL